MTTSFEIYFRDLTPKAQEALYKAFGIPEKEENWDVFPLAVIEIEREDNEAIERRLKYP